MAILTGLTRIMDTTIGNHPGMKTGKVVGNLTAEARITVQIHSPVWADRMDRGRAVIIMAASEVLAIHKGIINITTKDMHGQVRKIIATGNRAINQTGEVALAEMIGKVRSVGGKEDLAEV
jgi:hypothetical protein